MPEMNGFEYEIVETMFDDGFGKSCLVKKYYGPEGDILDIPSYINGIPVRYIDSYFWIYVRSENEIRFPETLITPSCSGTEKYVEIDLGFSEEVRTISVNKDNKWLFAEEGVLYIRGQENSKLNSILYRYPTGKPDKEFSVAEGCTTIFRHAFENVCEIEKIILGSVNEIGERAFEDCKNLKHINLNNVELIKKYAFSNCQSINEVYLSSKTRAESNAFWYCTGIKALHLESTDIDIPSNYLGWATELEKICLYGLALSRFTYIDGILYSFSKEGICPVFCPSSYPQKEIIIPDFVDYFESEVFCGNSDEDRVIYYSKNTEFISNTCTCDEFRFIEITHQNSRPIIENFGYLLYVQGPEQVNLDLSNIHDFGEIAFRDLKRIRHLTAGNLLSDEKIGYLQSIVQIDNIDDRPWLLSDKTSVDQETIVSFELNSKNLPAEKVIVPANHVIIVTSCFSCIHEKHDIRPVEIQVRVLSKGLVTVIPLKGFLCYTCRQCYVEPHVFASFINSFEPQTDNFNGIIDPTNLYHPKTRIIQNTFKTARGHYGEVYSSAYSDSEPDGLRMQSFPKWCGYSTYSIPFFEDGRLRNRLGIDLLKSIINSRLMSKADVMKLLTSLINLNRNKIKKQDSVYVWERDLEKIKNFEPNEEMKEVRYLFTLDKIMRF